MPTPEAETIHSVKESTLVYIFEEARAAFRFNLRGDAYETQKALKNAIARLCVFGDLDPEAIFEEDEDYVEHGDDDEGDEDDIVYSIHWRSADGQRTLDGGEGYHAHEVERERAKFLAELLAVCANEDEEDGIRAGTIMTTAHAS